MTTLFGKGYAPAYDVLYREKDYEGEVRLLDRIFRSFASNPVRTVLDLGCGTGNHALPLSGQGYEVTGVDRSPEMLTIASRKAREQARSLVFHEADLRRVDLGRTFDAILMMFAVLGYQIENADVRDAFEAARRHANPGALLVFDFWYGPAVLVQGTEERVRTIEHAGNTWVRTSSGKLDEQRHCIAVDFHLRRLQGATLMEETRECHPMRFFFPKELENVLESSGFRLLRLGAFPEIDREPDLTTWNVVAVATTSS